MTIQGLSFDPTCTTNAAVINAALRNSDPLVQLPAGCIHTREPVIVPPGKRLRGVLGSGNVPQTIIKPTLDWTYVTSIYQTGVPANDEYHAVVSTQKRPHGGSADIHFEALKIDVDGRHTMPGTVNGDPLWAAHRVHGLIHHATQGGSVTDCVIVNVTGYANYAQGHGDHPVRNIENLRVRTDRANAHHEIQYGEHIRYRDCHALHADDTVVASEVLFYAYGRCRNIEYVGCTGLGRGHGMFIQDGCEDIFINGGSFESLDLVGFLTASPDAPLVNRNLERCANNIVARDTVFVGRGGPGMRLDKRVRHARFLRCTFKAINEGTSATGNNNAIGIHLPGGPQVDEFLDCQVWAESKIAHAFGIAANAEDAAPPRFMFGKITLRSKPGMLKSVTGSPGIQTFNTEVVTEDI